MKKTIIAAIALTFAGFTQAAPLDVPDTNVVLAANNEEDTRVPVKLEELPENVKKTLAGDAYKGWTPASAFWVETKSSSYFEIELLKGDDKTFAKIDKQGQIVK